MDKWYWICNNEWLFDKKIRNELPLLIYISSLTASTGECWATNQHFAEKFKESTVNISRKVNKLEKAWIIWMEYIREGAKIKKRTIRLTKMLTHGYQNWQNTINKNVKENSIINNNININKEDVDFIYNHYIKKAKAIWSYNTKYNKKALGLERITKAIKLLWKEKVLDVINNYYKQNRDEISKGYVKMVQYFFWPVALGSKVMYYDDYITEGKEKKKPVDVDNLAF